MALRSGVSGLPLVLVLAACHGGGGDDNTTATSTDVTTGEGGVSGTGSPSGVGGTSGGVGGTASGVGGTSDTGGASNTTDTSGGASNTTDTSGSGGSGGSTDTGSNGGSGGSSAEGGSGGSAGNGDVGGSGGSAGTSDTGGMGGSAATGGMSGSGGSTDTGSTSGSGGSLSTSGGGGGGSGGTGDTDGAGGSGGSGGSGETGGSGGVTSTGGSGGSGGAGGAGCEPPEHAVCDTVTGCGCDDDENCHFEVGEEEPYRTCLPVGSVGPYSACSSNVDCESGYGCVEGICKRYCQTADDCGWENASCVPVEVDGEPAHPEWNVCAGDCDAVSPNEPAAGYQPCGLDATCLPLFETPISASSAVCAPAGPGGIGESCLEAGEPVPLACGAGLTCEFGVCLPWCDLAAPDCPDESPCIAYPFPTGRSVTERDLGVCYDGVVFQDDFSDCNNGWPDGDNVRPLYGFTCHDGYGYGYGYFSVWLDTGHYTLDFGPEDSTFIMDGVVEVDVRNDVGGSDTATGLSCGGINFEVRGDGAARITEGSTDLTDWVFSDAILTGSATNHLTARCVGEAPRLYTLYANGAYVLEFEHVNASPGEHTWLLVRTLTGSAFVFADFDNFTVREATGAELEAWLDE